MRKNKSRGRKKHYGYKEKAAFKKLPEHFEDNSVLSRHADRYPFLTPPGRGH